MNVVSLFRRAQTRLAPPPSQLDRDLAAFRSAADRADLAAALDRHTDDLATPIRDRIRFDAA